MKISGYTTVRNPELMNYPYIESIQSMLSNFDEVIVVDSSDVDDGSSEKLEKLMKKNKHLKVYEVDVNWDAPNFGVYDGKTKALARSYCTGDYCWQQDADEVIHPNIRKSIESVIEQCDFLNEINLLCLPVVEYWGSSGKVRADVNPWKWRVSKNMGHITHGIPLSKRRYENGLLYAHPGCDGCEYLDKNTGEMVPHLNFINEESEKNRVQAIHDENFVKPYEEWFNQVAEELPTVYHFSWWSVAEKIYKFKRFWNSSWLSLYGEKKPEGWNPFFERPIEQVGDNEIRAFAKDLEENTGGFIFHQKYDGSKTNAVHIQQPYPELMKEWCETNKT